MEAIARIHNAFRYIHNAFRYIHNASPYIHNAMPAIASVIEHIQIASAYIANALYDFANAIARNLNVCPLSTDVLLYTCKEDIKLSASSFLTILSVHTQLAFLGESVT